MDLQDKLELLNLTDRSKMYLEYIKLENVQNMVNMYVSMLAQNYDKDYLLYEIENDSPYSEVSTYLTHIIEIGGLLVMNLHKFEETLGEEAISAIPTVAIVINASLSTELFKHNLIDENMLMYYNNNALSTIAERLMRHYNRGRNLPMGLVDYTNHMAMANLMKF